MSSKSLVITIDDDNNYSVGGKNVKTLNDLHKLLAAGITFVADSLCNNEAIRDKVDINNCSYEDMYIATLMSVSEIIIDECVSNITSFSKISNKGTTDDSTVVSGSDTVVDTPSFRLDAFNNK